MSDLVELFKRIQHATAADREIDCSLALAIDGFFTVEADPYAHAPLNYCYAAEDGTPIHPGHGGDQLVPSYTASADAALRLASKVLPEHDYIMGSTNAGLTIHCQFGPRSDDMGFGETLPLAICAGMLKALLADREPSK